jgi:hypothetical protein
MDSEIWCFGKDRKLAQIHDDVVGLIKAFVGKSIELND